MKNQYFNEFEFNVAMDYVDKNPFTAKVKYEDYLNKYPNDHCAYTYYICCLILLGFLDDAKEHLEHLKEIINKEINFNYPNEKIKFLRKNIIFAYIKFYCYNHEYRRLEKLFKENFSVILDLNMKSVVFYCRKKLGKLEDSSREGNSYLYRQIIEYKEEDFYNHVQKHLADFNKDLDNPNSSIFSYDFPIDEVIDTVKTYIPSDKRLFSGFYEDSYVFKYDYCGKENNKVTNYFKVFCFHDTNNIITMCPSLNCEELPYIDLNYLNKSKNIESGKVKKLSQIDKFNQRYKLN